MDKRNKEDARPDPVEDDRRLDRERQGEGVILIRRRKG
jgi:hypothetical protein